MYECVSMGIHVDIEVHNETYMGIPVQAYRCIQLHVGGIECTVCVYIYNIIMYTHQLSSKCIYIIYTDTLCVL